MGSNCSPELANLTGLAAELSSLRTGVLPSFLLYARYIDDVLAVGTLTQLQLLPNLQIYPPHLTIRFGTPSKSVDFLDLHISIQNDSLRLRTHQKDVNAYLYPHAESNIHPPSRRDLSRVN